MRSGIGQLSLVEHALCPLDSKASLAPNLVFDAGYLLLDKHRHLRTAQARVLCPLGLTATDEFYLWGLLALTFAIPDTDNELHATPHFCLRRLGLIDQHARRGGRQYRQFADAIERLSVISYQNDLFYDPLRAEHRKVSFGFLSYSLPLDPKSSRAWRIVWNPLFFEFAKACGGCLYFDLETYRQLDPACRRLFLFVSKMFSRRDATPSLDLRHLAVNVLGFAPTLIARDLKAKVKRCVGQLVSLGVFAPPPNELYMKRGPGQYSLMLSRGPYYLRDPGRSMRARVADSPLYEPLAEIGLDDSAIARLLRQFPHAVLREWSDITLAAQERFGPSFFKRSPPAYFVDNVQKAALGTRTPPDWWHDLRKAERLAQTGNTSPKTRSELEPHLPTEAQTVLANVRAALGNEAASDGGRKRETNSNGGVGQRGRSPRPATQPVRLSELLK